MFENIKWVFSYPVYDTCLFPPNRRLLKWFWPQLSFLYPFPIFIRRWKRLGPKRKPPCQNSGDHLYDQLFDQLCEYMMNVSVAESTGYTNEEGRKVRVIGDISVRQIHQEYPDEFTQRFFWMILFIFEIYDFIKNRVYAINVFVDGKIGWNINCSVQSSNQGSKRVGFCRTVQGRRSMVNFKINLLSLNFHFGVKITKMITRMISRIFTNSP